MITMNTATISSSPGKTYTYDNLGRLSTEQDGPLLKTYSYNYYNDKVSSIEYATSGKVLGTEHFTYDNHEYLTEASFNGKTIFKLIEENELGQPTKVLTPSVVRKYTYDINGYPTARIFLNNDSSKIRELYYNFESETGNLKSLLR